MLGCCGWWNYSRSLLIWRETLQVLRRHFRLSLRYASFCDYHTCTILFLCSVKNRTVLLVVSLHLHLSAVCVCLWRSICTSNYTSTTSNILERERLISIFLCLPQLKLLRYKHFLNKRCSKQDEVCVRGRVCCFSI